MLKVGSGSTKLSQAHFSQNGPGVHNMSQAKDVESCQNCNKIQLHTVPLCWARRKL